MGKCLDLASCGFINQEKARFCARCGIPTKGAFLQGRYEITALTGKDRGTVTLQAIDKHGGQPVTVRALIPINTSLQEQENFLQDAELAMSLSSHINDPGSIRVMDYGQDGPVTFLIKAETRPESERTRVAAYRHACQQRSVCISHANCRGRRGDDDAVAHPDSDATIQSDAATEGRDAITSSA